MRLTLVAALCAATVPAGVCAQSGSSPPWIRLAGEAIPVLTGTNAVPGGAATAEARLVQPVLMVQAGALADRVRLDALADLEGWTIPNGELTAGAYGEGFYDRRHPHTYVHELMVTLPDGLRDLGGPAGLAPTCTGPSTGRAPGPTRRSGAPRSAGSAAPGTGCSSGRRPAKRAASTSSTRCSPRAPGASVGTGLTCDSGAPSAPRSNGSRTTSSVPRVRISTTASWGPHAGPSGRPGMAMARRSPPGGSPCNRRSRRQSHGSPASEAGCSTQQCSTGAGRSIPSASVYESTGAWPATAWGIMPAPPCRRGWPWPGRTPSFT